MNEALTNNLKIRTCTDVIAGSGCTIRRKVNGETFFAFKLAAWLTFVRESENHTEQLNQQLDLF